LTCFNTIDRIGRNSRTRFLTSVEGDKCKRVYCRYIGDFSMDSGCEGTRGHSPKLAMITSRLTEKEIQHFFKKGSQASGPLDQNVLDASHINIFRPKHHLKKSRNN